MVACGKFFQALFQLRDGFLVELIEWCMIALEFRDSDDRGRAVDYEPGRCAPVSPGFAFIKNTDFPVNFLSGLERFPCPFTKIAPAVGFRLVIVEVALPGGEIFGTAGGENVAAELAFGAAV